MNAFRMMDEDEDFMYWGCIACYDNYVLLLDYMLDIYNVYPFYQSDG